MTTIPTHVQRFIYLAIGIMVQNTRARILAPCGAGKSTFLRLLAKVLAQHDIRLVIAVQRRATAEALCKQLRTQDIAAALYLGYHAEECETLRGSRPSTADNPFAAPPCAMCPARAGCDYAGRDDAFDSAQAVVGTHDAVLRAMERQPSRFHGTVICFDEDPAPYEDVVLTSRSWQSIIDGLKQTDGLMDPFGGDDPAIRDAATAVGALREAFTGKAFTSVIAHVRPDIREQINPLLASLRKAVRSAPFREWLDSHRSANGLMVPSWCRHLQELLGILRPSYGQAAGIVALYDPKTQVVHIRRERFALRQSLRATARVYVLSATGHCHPTVYPADMPLVRCDSLQKPVPIELHIVWQSPTQRRSQENTQVGLDLLAALPPVPLNTRVLVMTGKNDPERDNAVEAVRQQLGLPLGAVVHLTRGSFTGENVARDCDIVFMASMPLFTQLADFGMTAAFHTGDDIPMSRMLRNGQPLITRTGAFQDVDIERVYQRHLVHEGIQAMFRGCVRSGKPMRVVLTLRRPADLLALHLAGITGFTVCAPDPSVRTTDEHRRFGRTAQMLTQVLAMRAGETVRKRDLYTDSGYNNHRTARVMVCALYAESGILQPVPGNNRLLVRTAYAQAAEVSAIRGIEDGTLKKGA